MHSLKHKGKKLLYLSIGTSYSREEVWLLESEIKVFEFHNNCCAAVRNWPSSLSIFIISLGEISSQMPIKRGLMNQSCSISITLLPLFCDLRATITSLCLVSPNFGHFSKHSKHSIEVYWMNEWMLQFDSCRQSHQRCKWKTKANKSTPTPLVTLFGPVEIMEVKPRLEECVEQLTGKF